MRIAVAAGVSLILSLSIGCSTPPPAKEGDACAGTTDGGALGSYCYGGELICAPPGTCKIACPIVTLLDGGWEGEADVDAGCPGSEACTPFDNSIGFCQ